jgi:DNA polymerase-3 subunit gamma/tau
VRTGEIPPGPEGSNGKSVPQVPQGFLIWSVLSGLSFLNGYGSFMGYEVLARKWRPQLFDEVVGQTHVTDTLANALKTGRLAHAYLFTGPRGIGKTSLARIFAKALNCKNGPTITPCGKCPSCVDITAGRSLDVLEIDGASNTGVDQVRDLRDNVRYAPTQGKFKIYIIDEVHMLSTAAFNALLKTLEEPPPHVKFIFATTEVQKILPTILSRCQRFDLRRITTPLIVERLALIAKTEKVKIEPDALLAIARGAEGGLRDAESALDQLIAFRGDTITEADVLSVFGLVSRKVLDQLMEAVLKGEIPILISTLGHLDEAGKDMARLVVEFLEQIRNLLVTICAGDGNAVGDLLPEQAERLRELAKLTDAERLLRMAEILMQAEDRIRFALSRRILVETALIRCARASAVVSIDELIARLGGLMGGGPAAGPSDPPDAPVQAPAGPARSETGAPMMEATKPHQSPVVPCPPTGPRRSQEYWVEDPGVKAVLETFNGRIVSIRDTDK